ncbi:hypothetical protein COO91_07027 [Nostoc flagelliforme CCNUN1]|uniref:Uncharacterized protein n=1 Tax=Nostoc flagelliforme CCNUN1 TaxID=2038116 RepID=A0A2K8SZZ2_9NOSO|nr:hypothetical protein COO91_07027 [Nostoc flagelliforme CCNUN1]
MFSSSSLPLQRQPASTKKFLNRTVLRAHPISRPELKFWADS